MSDVIARGSKVALRRKRLEDAWQDYLWRVDPELSQLDAATPTRVSFQEFLKNHHEELRHPLPWSRRYSVETVDGKYIGNCMCYDMNTVSGDAEVGIMIGDKEYWSRGYGTEAVTLLVEHVFQATSLRRLYLHTLDWNHRARRCFAKCGFREVKTVRRDGHTFVLMEMHRPAAQASPHRSAEGSTKASSSR